MSEPAVLDHPDMCDYPADSFHIAPYSLFSSAPQPHYTEAN